MLIRSIWMAWHGCLMAVTPSRRNSNAESGEWLCHEKYNSNPIDSRPSMVRPIIYVLLFCCWLIQFIHKANKSVHGVCIWSELDVDYKASCLATEGSAADSGTVWPHKVICLHSVTSLVRAGKECTSWPTIVTHTINFHFISCDCGSWLVQ